MFFFGGVIKFTEKNSTLFHNILDGILLMSDIYYATTYTLVAYHNNH